MVAVDPSGVVFTARKCAVFHAIGSKTIQRSPAFRPVCTRSKLREMERPGSVIFLLTVTKCAIFQATPQTTALGSYISPTTTQSGLRKPRRGAAPGGRARLL